MGGWPSTSPEPVQRLTGEGGHSRPALAALVAQAGGPRPAWPPLTPGTCHVRSVLYLKNILLCVHFSNTNICMCAPQTGSPAASAQMDSGCSLSQGLSIPTKTVSVQVLQGEIQNYLHQAGLPPARTLMCNCTSCHSLFGCQNLKN